MEPTMLRQLLCVAVLLSPLPVVADSTGPASASFAKLKQMLGDWRKENSDGKIFYISFQETANGSVLIENWIRKGKSHSLTVYHLDGEKLLATHYCPQENQPRLKLDVPTKEETISFTFQDATNLLDINNNHQHSLSFQFIDADKVVRNESYIENGTISQSSMTLVRQ